IVVGLVRLALLHVRARLEVLAEPAVFGRRVDDLADALAGKASRDGTDRGTHGGTDRARDRSGCQAAGGPADGGPDARLDRMRAWLVSDRIGVTAPPGRWVCRLLRVFLACHIAYSPEGPALSSAKRTATSGRACQF